MKNILILSLCVLAIVGCRKKKDTIVEITVKNGSNQVISSANVKLLTLPPFEANSTPVLELEGKTDINGVIRFNFNDVFQPINNLLNNSLQNFDALYLFLKKARKKCIKY